MTAVLVLVTMMIVLFNGLAIRHDAILAGWQRIGNKDGHILFNLHRSGNMEDQ